MAIETVGKGALPPDQAAPRSDSSGAQDRSDHQADNPAAPAAIQMSLSPTSRPTRTN